MCHIFEVFFENFPPLALSFYQTTESAWNILVFLNKNVLGQKFLRPWSIHVNWESDVSVLQLIHSWSRATQRLKFILSKKSKNIASSRVKQLLFFEGYLLEFNGFNN